MAAKGGPDRNERGHAPTYEEVAVSLRAQGTPEPKHVPGGTDPSPAVRAFLDALARLVVRDILAETEGDRNAPKRGEPHAMPRRTGSQC